MTSIIKNAIRCKKCGDIIESKSTHDFVWCSCKSCFVDGGLDYLRRGGDLENIEDLSSAQFSKTFQRDYKNNSGELIFKKGAEYTFVRNGNLFTTKCEAGKVLTLQEKEFEEIKKYFVKGE